MIDNLLKCGFCQDGGVCFFPFCISNATQKPCQSTTYNELIFIQYNCTILFFRKTTYLHFHLRIVITLVLLLLFFFMMQDLLNFCPSQNKTRQSVITVKELITGLKVITIVIMRHLVFQKHQLPVPYA